MSRFLSAVILILFLGTFAFAEDNAQQTVDAIELGPFPVTNNVQGVNVTASITSYFWVSTRADGIYLKVDVQSHLKDLQDKFASIVDTLPVPKDNCASYTLLNPVVNISSKSLTADGNAATIRLSGRVDGWTCIQNPVPQTYWDSNGCSGTWPWGGHYSFGCLKTRPGSPIKNQTIQQPFDAELPIYLKPTGNNAGVELVMGSPNVKLGGQFVVITNSILKVAGVDINASAKKALDSAIDPNKLSLMVPKEYMDLNPDVQEASFQNNNGELLASVKLSAKVPASKLNDFIKSLVSGLKPQSQ